MSLRDRDYMRTPPDGYGRSGGMNMLWGLILVNAAVFFLVPPHTRIYDLLALHCVKGNFYFYQLVTAGFMHANFTHILFNMYGLYIFGKLVIPHLSGRRFLVLYLAGVLCGNALFLALNWNVGIPLVGASGAVCAVMMAAAMLEPNQRFMMLFMPFTPIKTSTLIVCYTILEVIMLLTSAQSTVAHLAHLGGFVAGYLCVKLMCRGNTAWDPFRRKRTNYWQRQAAEERPDREFRSDGRPVSREELDALLDKISRHGINSLSPEELARLKQAREEMRR